MERSEQINEIAFALCKAQGEIANPPKNKTAKIPTKNGSSYSYEYADLPGINDAIRDPLKKNNLSISQSIDWTTPCLITTLMHSSGQWLSSRVKLFAAISERTNESQAWASAITFARRYGICCLLNLAAESDDDGAHSGEVASHPPKKAEPPRLPEEPFLTAEQLKKVQERADLLPKERVKEILDMKKWSSWAQMKQKQFDDCIAFLDQEAKKELDKELNTRME